MLRRVGILTLLAFITGCQTTEERSQEGFGDKWRHNNTQTTEHSWFAKLLGRDGPQAKTEATDPPYQPRPMRDRNDGAWFDGLFSWWRSDSQQQRLDNRMNALERRVNDLTRRVERQRASAVKPRMLEGSSAGNPFD